MEFTLPIINNPVDHTKPVRPVRVPEAVETGKKAYIVTFGCQMNELDTQTMYGLLAGLGYEKTYDIEEADLILYNTCSVRENPERKVYGQVHSLKELKEKKPDLIIGISGCMPQSKVERQKLWERLPHVDLIFGTMNIHRLPELITQVQQTGQRVMEVWDEHGDIVEGLPVVREDKLKAFVTIIYGCDYRCSFCIVPQTRGRQRSRRAGYIINEVEQLAAEGYKEVTLLGQTVDAYGKDLGDGTTLASLLWRLNEIDGIERLRFMTSHPRDITDELIDCMRDAEKVMEQLHLPVQSGNDRILKLMGRRYNRRQYLELVEKLRANIPDLTLTTDIIVGFPGETEEEFEDTISLVKEVEYDSAFMFIYSPRPGTGAPNLPDHVPEEVKRERIHRLIEVQNEISARKNAAMVGSVQEVLVEGKNEKEPGMLNGRTRGNKIVTFPGGEELVGRIIPVRITRARTWTLVGEAEVPAVAGTA
ncbi:MAG: tRNA (N6-isopentenyl adenosine(37)-C2)-methylthiotransferase MiaB [Bacillota bacterium]|nr:MAG: tRNA (N6-isopentenyl adenosine(37)-C2)-methylthiotransferase MiaB [Bacillota bacterium]